MSREMKDSGIEWLGKIPKNWKIFKIKNTSWLKGRIGWDGLKASEFIENGPYLITGTDFCNGYINWKTCVHITKNRFEEDELLHIQENDLLITKDGTIGKVAIVKKCPKETSLNSGVMIIRNNSKYVYDTKYMYYILLSDEFKHWFEYCQKPGSTIKHLYQHQFSEFKYAFPTLEEQQEIVDYLDAKCHSIEQAIQKQKDIVEKLKEYRQSVITKAVTKGLNPDVEMKAVKMDFANSIPQTWECSRLKFHCRITNGSDPKLEGNIPVYGSGSEIVKYCGEFKNGPAILIGRKGTLDKPKLVEGKYWNVDTAMDLHPDSHMNYTYLYYVISCFTIDKYSTCTAKPSMTQNDYYNILIPVPSISEQNKIVQYVTSKCNAINDSIKKNNQIINKLEEYKKSLIYNAVTGKIDCRKETEI